MEGLRWLGEKLLAFPELAAGLIPNEAKKKRWKGEKTKRNTFDGGGVKKLAKQFIKLLCGLELKKL